MPDIDGYVSCKTEYDESGYPYKELFLDKDGEPWRNPDGVYGTLEKFNKKNGTFVSQNLDEKGLFISKTNGSYKTIISINDRHQLKDFYELDIHDNLVEDDSCAIKSFEFTDQNKLKTIKGFDKEHNLLWGQRFDLDKRGIHVIREYSISDTGISQDETWGVEGFEYEIDGDNSLPILQRFINEYKQYKKCNDGYFAIRSWEDEKEQIVKQKYYNIDGTPMPDKNGVYGVKIETIDEETTKRINLSADDTMMEDNNGVAYTIVKKTKTLVQEINYNLVGEPHADDDWVYINNEIIINGECRQERLSVLNAQRNHITILRQHKADPSWEPIVCVYDETTYDEKGRLVSQFFKNENYDLLADSVGDSYTIWEYDDENNIEILSLFTYEQKLKLRVQTNKDNKGRVIGVFYLDQDGKLADLERGYSGETYEYDDLENTKIVSFINTEGNICNNRDGFAQRIHWYDNYGREIAQKDKTAEGIIHGLISFREFLDSEKRECAYYLHREDAEGNVVPNDNGSVFDYFEDDEKGRTIKQLYLNEDKMPISDNEGDYGLSYEYVEDRNLTIIKCLDENAIPHNNNLGYCIMHVYNDENGKEIKRMYFDIDGNPTPLPSILDCYGVSYEYPNEHNKIVGYLDMNEKITTNKHGYSYREECFNPENGLRRVFYYNELRNNTQSLEDDNKEFGFAISENENWRRIVSLSTNGSVTNNECGYAVKSELYEEGKLRFYKFHDENDKPVTDSVGDYGTEVQRSDDGSMTSLVSLNKEYERHINMYGYCYCDIFTNITGEQIRIWRDLEGNQVLPKLRRVNSIQKKFSSLFKKSKKTSKIVNCRQIGAVFDCILGNIEKKGLGKKMGLHGTYVLLQYDTWRLGDNSDELGNLLQNSAKQHKHVTLLPVKLDGSLLVEVGDVIELSLPAGQIGMRFMDWGINIETIRIILEKRESFEAKE